jgi:cytochrome c
MDDRTNTIAGWVLFSLIVALGSSIVVGEMFHNERPEKMGYPIQGVEEETDGAAPAEQPIEVYLASANPAQGAEIFKKCAACHKDGKGEPNAIGPNLWGVVGSPRAHTPGFAYSDALKSKGGNWDWDTLAIWLKSPKAFAPGTKMTFAGLSKPEDRANIIAYLNTESDHPLPVPAAPKATAAAGQPPAAGMAEKEPVLNEAQAAKQPKQHVGGEGAPTVSGTKAQTKL